MNLNRFSLRVKVLSALTLVGAIIYGQSIMTKFWNESFNSPNEEIVETTTVLSTDEVQEQLNAPTPITTSSAFTGSIRHEMIEGKYDLFVVEVEGVTVSFRPDAVQFAARDEQGMENIAGLRLQSEGENFTLKGINEQSNETVDISNTHMGRALSELYMNVTYYEQLQYEHTDGTIILFSISDTDIIAEMNNRNFLPKLKGIWFRDSEHWAINGDPTELRRALKIKPLNASNFNTDENGGVSIDGTSNSASFKISILK